MNVVTNVVGADTELGETLTNVSDVATALASGKPPEDVARESVKTIKKLLQEASVLPKDSQLADKAERAIAIAGKVDDLFKKGLQTEASKLIDEFNGISKEFSGLLNDPAKAAGMDGAMIPALGVLQAGLKIADICRKWDQLSDLGKVAASLDGLTSAAMAAQAFCTVAVCEIKGPIILLATLLKDLINLGIDLGLDGPNLFGSGQNDSAPPNGPADAPPSKSPPADSEPSAAGQVANQAAARGDTAEQIGEAVAAAVNSSAVKDAVAKAVTQAREKKKDVGEAVASLDEVKRAELKQREQDAETAKSIAEDNKKAPKPDTPQALAESAVAAHPELASDKEQLRNLILAELKPGRSTVEALGAALARLRAEKAVRKSSAPVK